MAGSRRRTRARPVTLDGRRLTLEEVERIADGAPCRLAREARTAVAAGRRAVEAAVAGGQQVYGVNTGFGNLARVRVDDDQLERLQQNLVRSHCAGVGPALPERVVRSVLALRANCLARGHSGIRLTTLQRVLDMLKHGIHPVVPEQGSVGASGDLAPLAHVALALIGEGRVVFRGRNMPASAAWKRVGLEPPRLKAKEGLALINGTQVMTALGTLTLLRLERLCVVADILGAMTLEALLGSHRAMDPRIHAARGQPGQMRSAARLRRVFDDSAIERSHADCGEVQDCYSLRCIPQVHGAVDDAARYVRRTLEVEINASTDNPMVFADEGELLSGGNFHGQPVSLALDHLGVAACSLATISERRTDRLLHPELSGLPAFLAADPGLDSGFMLAQVTSAALVSENKVLAHPASVDTVPTSAGKEDHVSMGVHAARKAVQIVDNVSRVLAIEWVCAAQALDLRRPLRGGRGVEAARRQLRRHVRRLEHDRVLAGDIETARERIEDGTLTSAVERAVGTL